MLRLIIIVIVDLRSDKPVFCHLVKALITAYASLEVYTKTVYYMS